MRWNDITVWQYQNIVKALSDKSLDDIDKSFKLIALVYNMTDNQVDSLLQEDYKAKIKDLELLTFYTPNLKVFVGRETKYNNYIKVRNIPYKLTLI